jgi:glycosyltransferase involved in cell wall biosynthesis
VTLVSVQPFGVESPGGGSRILRALFDGAPTPIISVATSSRKPPSSPRHREIHAPARPTFGRLEATRAISVGPVVERVLSKRLSRRIAEVGAEGDVTAIHAIAHGGDFWAAFRAARMLDVPFFLTVHDDVRYVLRRSLGLHAVLRRLGMAWRAADHRFVISRAIGEEYCDRYGRRRYSIVTDGLDEDDLRVPKPAVGLNVYFAGLFHLGYGPNLQTLLDGLESAVRVRPDIPASVTCRSGSVPVRVTSTIPLTVLPFGSANDVVRDLEAADLLYLPLPFPSRYRDFFRFSLSTKLVTYLGSGRPILYHGPPEGAAYEVLSSNDAAILVTTPDSDAVSRALLHGAARTAEIAANALTLARREFVLSEQQRQFWTAVLEHGRARVPR